MKTRPKVELSRPDVKLTCGDLVLTFFWDKDRYQHRLVSGTSNRESVDAKAIESPAFSDLHEQGDVLFASGSAGDSHWSMSVEPVADGFVFDVACRAKSFMYGKHGWASFYGGDGLQIEADEKHEAAAYFERGTDDRVWLVTTSEHKVAKPPCTIRYRYLIYK